MIRIFEDLEVNASGNNKALKVYNNILRVIKDKEAEIEEVSNVHTIPLSKTKDGKLNITFDYDYDYTIQINIVSEDEIELICPKDMEDGTFDLISGEYPEYIKKIKTITT